jgi:hypothetical protein
VKALLDEQLSPEIAELLRRDGYDVEAVVDREDLVGANDRIVFDVACREDRAVVTNNIKDSRPLAAERLAQGSSHAGLILLPSSRSRSRAAIGALVAEIGELLRAHSDGIAGSERWIAPLRSG